MYAEEENFLEKCSFVRELRAVNFISFNTFCLIEQLVEFGYSSEKVLVSKLSTSLAVEPYF